MPVFVTGGTGFIGRSVVRELRRRSYVVRALARSDKAERTLRELGAEPVRGDLRDLDTLRGAVVNADAVVTCAFEYSEHGVSLDRAAIETMLDALPAGRAFIYTSGVWVYGSRGDAIVAEDAPVQPVPLVAWRPAHEELVLSQEGRLRTVVVRPGVVYGDGGGIPGTMVEQARAGQLRLVGDGANRWSTVRHDALAELYALLVERPIARGIYNASRGAAVPYVEIADACARAAGVDVPAQITLEEGRALMGPVADAFAADCQIDSSRAQRELGWEPHRPTILEELSASVVI